MGSHGGSRPRDISHGIALPMERKLQSPFQIIKEWFVVQLNKDFKIPLLEVLIGRGIRCKMNIAQSTCEG